MSGSLPPGSRCLYDARSVDHAVDRVAVEMALKLWDARPVVVCLMNGGLPFTADLLRRFYFDLELDYMHLARYEHQQGGDIRVLRKPTRALTDRTVLLVDDVLDEGQTLRAAQRLVAEAGASQTVTAVLVRKAVRDPVARSDFAALDAPDEFLVGRGMDCDGAFRQLSGIYCLPSSA